jgi:hypothetical protein
MNNEEKGDSWSGDYTTDISDGPLSRSKPVASTVAFLSGTAASP